MAASVCSAPEIWKPLGDWIGRPSAEITPVVSDPCSPNGEPMATAGWPTCTEAEEPRASGFSPPSTPAGSTFSTARSLDASVPATFAEMRSSLSPMRTRTVSAPADDVVVGEDVAARVEDEARAGARLALRARARGARARLHVDDAVADLVVERGDVGGRARGGGSRDVLVRGRRDRDGGVAVTVVERAREGEDREDGGDDPRAEERAQEVAPGTGRHATTVLRRAQSSVNPPRVGSRHGHGRAADGRADRGARRSAAVHRLRDRGAADLHGAGPRRRAGAGRAGGVPVHARRRTREMYRRQAWTMRQYAGYASAKESNERYSTCSRTARPGLSMAFDLPTQLGLDSDDPRSLGRGGPHRRRDRHDRRHAHRVRRDPARRGLDVDDDQRAGGGAADALPARRRGAGRRPRAAARHDAERRAQGVHRPRELHLPAGARRCA